MVETKYEYGHSVCWSPVVVSPIEPVSDSKLNGFRLRFYLSNTPSIFAHGSHPMDRTAIL